MIFKTNVKGCTLGWMHGEDGTSDVLLSGCMDDILTADRELIISYADREKPLFFFLQNDCEMQFCRVELKNLSIFKKQYIRLSLHFAYKPEENHITADFSKEFLSLKMPVPDEDILCGEWKDSLSEEENALYKAGWEECRKEYSIVYLLLDSGMNALNAFTDHQSSIEDFLLQNFNSRRNIFFRVAEFGGCEPHFCTELKNNIAPVRLALSGIKPTADAKAGDPFAMLFDAFEEIESTKPSGISTHYHILFLTDGKHFSETVGGNFPERRNALNVTVWGYEDCYDDSRIEYPVLVNCPDLSEFIRGCIPWDTAFLEEQHRRLQEAVEEQELVQNAPDNEPEVREKHSPEEIEKLKRAEERRKRETREKAQWLEEERIREEQEAYQREHRSKIRKTVIIVSSIAGAAAIGALILVLMLNPPKKPEKMEDTVTETEAITETESTEPATKAMTEPATESVTEAVTEPPMTKYEVVMGKYTWISANGYSGYLGGTMATVHSDEEWDALVQAAEDAQKSEPELQYLWVGANSYRASIAGREGNRVKWTDESEVNYILNQDNCWYYNEAENLREPSCFAPTNEEIAEPYVMLWDANGPDKAGGWVLTDISDAGEEDRYTDSNMGFLVRFDEQSESDS